MTPDTTNWDKGKFYLAKNHSEVWIYIPSPIGEWKQFFAQEKNTKKSAIERINQNSKPNNPLQHMEQEKEKKRIAIKQWRTQRSLARLLYPRMVKGFYKWRLNSNCAKLTP